MADHQRKQIRDAVFARLNGATAAQGRVFNHRVDEWLVRELEIGPCLSVYAIDETTDTGYSVNTAPRELRRALNLAIEFAVVQAAGALNIDDQIDALCQQIEREMDRDRYFTVDGKPVCRESILASTNIVVTGEGKDLIGNARLIYEFSYNTQAPEPEDVTLVPFNSAGIKTSLDGRQLPDDQSANEVSFVAPPIYVEAAAVRPAVHGDNPQPAEFKISELLAAGLQLWIDGAASMAPGDYTFRLTHLATATVVATDVITAADGRVLDQIDLAGLAAIEASGPFGAFELELLDPALAQVSAVHFSLFA